MNKAVERQINKIYNEIYKKVFNKTTTSMLLAGNTSFANSKLIELENSDKYDEFCKKFAQELSKKGLSKQRGVWRKFFEAAKASKRIALPMTYKDFEFKQMSKIVKHNFEMIKSIPSKMKEILEHKYLSTLMEEVMKGSLPRGSFAKQLSVHAGKQAKVIARTETAKLQTAITENSSVDLGSVCYFWKSSRDIRTRPSHRMMNGVIVFWRQGEEKPLLDGMYGNAGEFPNCRCDAQPIFDSSDLTQSFYQVYNYTIHMVVTMSKKELLNKIAEIKAA